VLTLEGNHNLSHTLHLHKNAVLRCQGVTSFSIESIELAIVFQIVEYIPVVDRISASEGLQHS